MAKESSLPHRFNADAVFAEVIQVPRAVRREHRRRLSTLQRAIGVPVAALAAVITLAIPVCTFLYAVYGTAVPFLTNARGPAKGPASADERIVAATLCTLFTAMLVWVALYALRRRLARPVLALDTEGIWLGRQTRGRQVDDGLRWDQIAGVHVVPVDGQTTVPTAHTAAPLVEVFPAQPVKSDTPLSFRVVNAPPPAPGLRGKRYVFGLTPGGDTTALIVAIDRWAPKRRIDSQPTP